jgi:hypothetical protein
MENEQAEQLNTKPKLCYISVAALFLAIFTLFVMSPPRDSIPLNIFTILIAMIALLRIKFSDVKIRGKGLAIAAFVISFLHMFLLFASWLISISDVTLG